MSKIVYTRETTNDNIGTVETFYEAQADELSGEALSPYFESSESVTKSLNQSGNIEFSVDADIVQKVDRAVLTPASAPSEDVVPVVDSTNAVSYKPLSEIGSGGGGGGGGLTPRKVTLAELQTFIVAESAGKLFTIIPKAGSFSGMTMVTSVTLDSDLGYCIFYITGQTTPAFLAGAQLVISSSLSMCVIFQYDYQSDGTFSAPTTTQIAVTDDNFDFYVYG